MSEQNRNNRYFTKQWITKENPYGLNPVLLTLWKAPQEHLPPSMLERLRTTVREAKYYIRKGREGVDPLVQKLENWGNQGAWGKHQLRQLSKALYSDKRPHGERLGDWVSVEIECIVEYKDDLVVSLRKIKNASSFITVKGDGSIRDLEEDEEGVEIVVTFLKDNPSILQEVCEVLESHGARVNQSCGLHVHFDFRHLRGNSRKLSTFANRVAVAVPALKLMLPHSRRNNRYCEAIISKGNSGNARYAFVNTKAFSKHETLEIRGHSGTTSYTKIINWITLLSVIMNTKRARKEVTTIAGLLSEFALPAELRDYIQRRAKCFMDSNAGENSSTLVNDNIIFAPLDPANIPRLQVRDYVLPDYWQTVNVSNGGNS